MSYISWVLGSHAFCILLLNPRIIVCCFNFELNWIELNWIELELLINGQFSLWKRFVWSSCMSTEPSWFIGKKNQKMYQILFENDVFVIIMIKIKPWPISHPNKWGFFSLITSFYICFSKLRNSILFLICRWRRMKALRMGIVIMKIVKPNFLSFSPKKTKYNFQFYYSLV